MAKVLKADASSGSECYVQLDFGPEDDTWVTLDVWVRQDALDLWSSTHDSSDASGSFANLWATVAAPGSPEVGVFTWDDGPGPTWVVDRLGPAFDDGPFDACTWYTIELRIEAGVALECYIDGSLIVTTGPLDISVKADRLRVGQEFAYMVDPAAVAYIDNVKVGRTRGASDIFSDDFESGSLAGWSSVVGAMSIVDAPTCDAGDPVIVGSSSASENPWRIPWRWVVTADDCSTITIIERLARDQQATYILNHPAVAEMKVPSDNSEVNIPYFGDDDPFVSYGNRFLYGFRREGGLFGTTTPPLWICRYAGILQILEDEAESEQSMSHLVANDPWQYLYARPVMRDSGAFPGRDGRTYRGRRGDQIIVNMLENTLAAHGSVHIDWGQTAFYGGTIEATDVLEKINFPQMTSIGEAWDQLVATNTLDIVLTPVYDPINRPGILCELNVYETAGSNRNVAVFAWDKPSRSLVGISRLRDASQLANKVKFYGGQGGLAVPTETDAASVTKYGQYWTQQAASQKNRLAVELLALAELGLRARGKLTLTVDPAPERSPFLFREYFLGDKVPVYASNRFRQPLATKQRVYAIPVTIDDDQTEKVERLLLTDPDG